MARYTGPKTKIARRFGQPIFGDDKSFEKKKYPPGQHGPNRRRGKKSEYAIQLEEKQKAKYRSEEHTSELQSRGHIVCRRLLEKIILMNAISYTGHAEFSDRTAHKIS